VVVARAFDQHVLLVLAFSDTRRAASMTDWHLMTCPRLSYCPAQALPVGPNDGDEVCFDRLASTTFVDSALPAPGTGFWYLSRGENACGVGTFGNQSNGSPRITTTCP
jgi:hypothetical protein